MNKKFLPDWQVQSPLVLDSHRTTIRTSELAAPKKLFAFNVSIDDFHEENALFHLSSICCKHRHRCYSFNCCSTRKIKFSLPWEILKELVNSPRKNKWRFAISHEQNNLFHPNFTSCRRRHQYYISFIQILEQLQFFFESISDLHYPDAGQFNMFPRVPEEFSCKEFVCCVSFFFSKGKNEPKFQSFFPILVIEVLVYYRQCFKLHALTQFRFVENLKLTFNWF